MKKYKYSDKDTSNGKSFYDIFTGINDKKVRYEVIEYQSLMVYPWFKILIGAGCRIDIRWIKSKRDYLQGINVGMRNAKVKLLDGSNSIIKSGHIFTYDFWYPEAITLYCIPIKYHPRGREQGMQSRWIGLHSFYRKKLATGLNSFPVLDESWLGTYGLVIERRNEHGYRLYFSCGYKEYANVTFEDLIVDVFISGEYAAEFQCSKFKF